MLSEIDVQSAQKVDLTFFYPIGLLPCLMRELKTQACQRFTSCLTPKCEFLFVGNRAEKEIRSFPLKLCSAEQMNAL